MQAITGNSRLTCLTSLIGIQSKPCVAGSNPALFIEELDGVDIDKLSKIAGPADISGYEMAKKIINSAALEMLGDLEMMLNNGYSIKQNIAEVCSTCAFNSIYVPGGGIKIHNAGLSKYSSIKLTSVKIKANATGTYNLIVDDRITPQSFEIELEAGVMMPVLLNYTTTQRDVYVSLEDQTVGLAQIICPASNSCGCAGSTNKNIISYSGMIGAVASTSQYGFIACSNVTCNNDTLICELIKQTPNLIGLTLLYKVGEKINNNAKLTLRNNRVSAQPNEEKDTEMIRYMSLYTKKMQGTKTEMGLKTVISNYLKSVSRDQCIECNSLRKVSYVTG